MKTLFFVSAAIMALSSHAAAQAFSFSDFSNVAGLSFAGNASQSGTTLRLTTAATAQSGSAFYDNKVPVTAFSTTFQFQITGQGGGGADGFSFNVRQGGPALESGAVGESGTNEGLAVQFDTFQNAGDPSANFIRLRLNGSTIAENSSLSVDMSDGAVHTIVFTLSTTGRATLKLDNSQVFSVSGIALEPGSPAYVGFAARTGGSFQNHDIASWSFSSGQTTRTVTKTSDTNDGLCNSDCSLREAVAAAMPGDAIVFASPTFDSSRILTISSPIVISNDLTIIGRSPSQTTILITAASGPNSRVLRVNGGQVSLVNLAITNGRLSGSTAASECGQHCGAGIYNSSDLTLTNVAVSSNTISSTTGAVGAGIYNSGILTIATSLIDGNVATGATASGAGVFNSSTGTLRVSRSIISRNTAGNVASSGAGVKNEGEATLTDSTLYGNIATGGSASGGGIENGGNMTIVNTTLTANQAIGTADAKGGGIMSAGAGMFVTNATIAGNAAGPTGLGGGIYFSSGAASLRNSILAGNMGGAGTNFDGPAGFANNSNIFGGDSAVRLAPLGHYGGQTLTMALLPGSVAIDAGDNCVIDLSCSTNNPPVTLVADGRGRSRFGGVDIGAFEAQPNKVVTKTADSDDGSCDSDCSLREAVAAAASGDMIEFASPLFDSARTVEVNGQITVDKNVTIVGRSAKLTTIRNVAPAGPTSRVFYSSSNTLNLNRVTITGGRLLPGFQVAGCTINSSCGGGVYANSRLGIADSVITGNLVLDTNETGGGNAGGGGGGVFLFTGNLDIFNSTISENGASGNRTFGGGISVVVGNMTLTSSTVSGNHVDGSQLSQGGGINFNSGSAYISGSTITNNSATIASGGFGGGSGVLKSLRNTIVSGNSAPTFTNLFGTAAVSENNLIDTDARLLPLGDYGGAGPTHALLSNSPAINSGNDCVLTGTCTSFAMPIIQKSDQRGADRVGRTDVGAFESNSASNGGSFRAVLPNGRASSLYSTTLVPTLSAGITFSLAAGSLPDGLSLGATALTDGSPINSSPSAPQAALVLSGTPTSGGLFSFSIVASDGTNTSTTDYQMQVLTPTSAGVSVEGRVLSGSGRGVANAFVMLTDSTGQVRTVKTAALGYFRFDDVAAGQTVVLNVKSRKFSFAPKVVFLSDSVTALDLVGTP